MPEENEWRTRKQRIDARLKKLGWKIVPLSNEPDLGSLDKIPAEELPTANVPADQLEARYAKAHAHLDKLTQSLLAKAFRGELVPQDPNDELASVLLARIRSAIRGAENSRRRKANCCT